jgi:hypothetical protein
MFQVETPPLPPTFAPAVFAELARQLVVDMMCAWHWNCDQRAFATAPHPVLGQVAICHGCAVHDGLAVTPLPQVA